MVRGAGDFERDREILSVLYNTTGGPEWFSSDGWFDSDNLSLWYGLRVNETSSTVEEISLYQNNLRGETPMMLCCYKPSHAQCA